MRRRTKLLLASSVLGLLIPIRANAIVIVGGFEGAGVQGTHGIIVNWHSSRAGTAGIIIVGGTPLAAPVEASLSCAYFAPAPSTSATPVKVGGTFYGFGMGSDGHYYAVQAFDGGPGGADTVGIIIVGGQPSPTDPYCGASAVPMSPFNGDVNGFIIYD
ncbi:MAG: hypothetical protein ABR548_06535 [Actinomycetota bacterium]|nr:hypothetical protein [Actinomycetota bacterium]